MYICLTSFLKNIAQRDGLYQDFLSYFLLAKEKMHYSAVIKPFFDMNVV